jgi:hypothetical protein
MMARSSVLLVLGVLAFSGVRAAAQTQAESGGAPAAARITQAIDESQLVRLAGNVHPLAQKEFDQGRVSGLAPMKRMLLLLKRSADQESAVAQLMVDQYNANSPNFHKWLTPEQFGTQFGPSDADIQTVTTWLRGHGFEVAKVSKGRIAIEFSGTAAQIREAFHTEIHTFVVNGEKHLANASDPQIPAALAPVIKGLAPLNNFRAKPAHHVAGEFTKSTATGEVQSVKPEFTTSGGNYAIGPTDFATIYNVAPLWAAGTDGTGQSIAVIGVSNINPQDITDFRTLFGLTTTGAAKPIVVIDGADPGIINDGSETEALLDVEWSGAVAKGAQIHLVIAADTDIASGFLLAVFNVLDNNSDPILSFSFGNCEPNLGVQGNNLFLSLWEQAAAQGITVNVATGDPGSAGCEDQNAHAPNPAKTGLQVSGFASTPFNVAVGGTDFNDAGTQLTYFNASNDPTFLASAKGYIPESTWNESCTNAAFGANAEANCNNAANQAAVITVGGSGGASHCFTLTGTTCSGGYAKPAYQSFITAAHGMPNDGHRDIPDVSLFASSGFNKSFYAVCEADKVTAPSCMKNQMFHFLGVGGTSASTPSFAGIMALVNQKNGRQGNANFALYKLGQLQFQAGTACNSLPSPAPNANCTFNDVTTGTIAMPCTKGTMDCTASAADAIGVLNGFNATAGYDLATGLGTINANNLVNNWANALTVFTPTTVTLALSPTTGLTAGQNATVNIAVTPKSGTGTPSGDVSLTSNAATGNGVDGFKLDANGAVVNGTTNQLTGGTYMITARYGGDGTFAPSVSLPVSVTVGKASSTATGSVLVSTGGGKFATFTSGPGPVTLFLKAIIGSTVTLLPTGTVDFVDTVNGVSTTVASKVGVNSASEAFTASGIPTFTAGNHSIVANYSGDASFTASTSAAVTFTITAAGTFSVAGSAVVVTAGSSQPSTITVTPSGGFTGAVNVTCQGLPAGVTCSPNPLAINVTGPAVTGQLAVAVAAPSTTLTASAAPAQRPLYAAGMIPSSGEERWWALSAGTGLAALLLLFLPGRKRYRAALGLGLVCVLSFTLGCSSTNYGGGGGGAVPTQTTITANSAKLASTDPTGFKFTINVTASVGANGQVQLFDGTGPLGSRVTVSNGSTTITTAGLPAGTHSISAHYLGDAKTQASSSGMLNVTSTGTGTFVISTTPAASNGTPTVNITIN